MVPVIRMLVALALVAACHEHGAQPEAPAPRPMDVAAPAQPTDAPAPIADTSLMVDASVPDARRALDAGVAKNAPGKHGDVCALGRRHQPGEPHPKVVECGPGLQCCYPCGVQGCDSVCHTQEECRLDQMRP
jgi:hypothetical protein